MYILVLMVIVAVVCIVLIKKIDQRRWYRYQIERDLFFRDHPLELNGEDEFNIQLSMNKSAQFKLINGLMLKSEDKQIYKKAIIQRDEEQQHQQFIIKVMIEDITIGYLEKKYAGLFCQSLEKTDFYVGRPISVLAEVSFFENRVSDKHCIVRLNLPSYPKQAKQLLLQKN